MITPRLYDTMSREIVALEPEDGRRFRFYCCGPTVYGPAHIGNFRTFVLQDVFRRMMEADGLATLHVRNLTDVDDKTIRNSQQEGKLLGEFTKFWTKKFQADGEALNMLPPHNEASAVEHIPEQIALIERLVERDHAYVGKDGSVYFRIGSFQDYGRLSRVQDRELKEGASGAASAVDSDEYDRDSVNDFALWKGRKPEDGDNFWESPWGEGRPGWHIECSAMAMKYLGETFDLHGGGIDLCFPHHENEIAQSEAASGKPFARHWFHVEHLMVEGAKMSKSLGNLYTLEDVEKRGHTAMELRYVLISGHYRKQLNFTWDSMEAARKALLRLAKLDAALRQAAGIPEDKVLADSECVFEEVGGGADSFLYAAWEALLDDLNVPEALGRIFVDARKLEKALASERLDADAALRFWTRLQTMLFALGLKLPEVPDEDAAASDAPDDIREWAEQRWQAKKDRDFAKADELRDKIADAGWQIKDRKDGFDLMPG